jgi:hypothetical protein
MPDIIYSELQPSQLTGAKSRTIYMKITSAVNAPMVGLVFNTAGILASYNVSRGARVAITLATQTVTGAWATGGFVEVDATNMPGVYRLDVPDAAWATGDQTEIVIWKTATFYGAALVPVSNFFDVVKTTSVRTNS